MNEQALSCDICYKSLQITKVLECGHEFCSDCVDKWKKENPTCPTCRADFNEDRKVILVIGKSAKENLIF